MPEIVTLQCSVHKKPLFVGKHGGVIHYTHEDGEACQALNSFTVTADGILSLMGRQEKEESAVLRAAFSVSLVLRLQYYHAMQTTDTERLKKFLKRVYALIRDAHNELAIAGEMETVFGPVIWENFRCIGVTESYSVNRVSPDYPAALKLPRLDMINVEDAERTSTFLDIDKAVEVKTRNARFGR
jgi:hypothetical protein